MSAEAALPSLAQSRSSAPVLIAIPVGFALLGLILRLIAYLQAGWEPQVATFADGLCRWDCEWYVILAKSGYDTFPTATGIDAGNWAFFPLYPIIVGALHAASGAPVMVLATGASIIFSAIAALVAWPLLNRDIRAYTLYSAFLLCGPFSIYFTTFYTEVLFVLLTNCVFLALQRSNYLMAGVSAAFLSATRIVGVFAVFAIALQFWLDYRARGGTLRGLVPTLLQRRPDVLLAIAIAPLGCFAYMAYLHWFIGDALAFQHVQRAWGRVAGNPLLYLSIAFTDWPKDGSWWPSTNQWLGIAAVGGLLLAGVLAWQRKWPAAVFCLICLVIPLCAGMASMLRFVVALSPIMLAAMSLLARWRWLFAVSLIAFVAADYFFTVGWLREWLALV